MPDPYFILPVTILIINLLGSMSLTALYKPQYANKYSGSTWMYRAWSLCVAFPLALHLPSTVTLYWAITSLSTLSMNIALSYPQFRRMCGLPQDPKYEKTFSGYVKELLSKIRSRPKIAK